MCRPCSTYERVCETSCVAWSWGWRQLIGELTAQSIFRCNTFAAMDRSADLLTELQIGRGVKFTASGAPRTGILSPVLHGANCRVIRLPEAGVKCHVVINNSPLSEARSRSSGNASDNVIVRELSALYRISDESRNYCARGFCTASIRETIGLT